jgi:hypothetical protein
MGISSSELEDVLKFMLENYHQVEERLNITRMEV